MRTQPALIFIPTYNEAENAALFFEEIKKLKLPADVVFMDDNSPDGTGAIIDELARVYTQQTIEIIFDPGLIGPGYSLEKLLCFYD